MLEEIVAVVRGRVRRRRGRAQVSHQDGLGGHQYSEQRRQTDKRSA